MVHPTSQPTLKRQRATLFFTHDNFQPTILGGKCASLLLKVGSNHNPTKTFMCTCPL